MVLYHHTRAHEEVWCVHMWAGVETEHVCIIRVCVCVCVYKNTHSSPECFIINMAAPSGLPHLHWFCHNWWGLHVAAQPFPVSLTFLSLYFISQISTTPLLRRPLSDTLTRFNLISSTHTCWSRRAGMLVNSAESENITTELKQFSEDELLITFGEPPWQAEAPIRGFRWSKIQ